MNRDIAHALLEIAIFAIGIYLVLRLLGTTRGSGVVRGLAIVLIGVIVVFSILIQELDLRRLGLIFDKLRDIALLGLIIVFQPEIRRGIVHLGESPLFGRMFRREVKTLHRLLLSVKRLSRERIGALIAIEREASLAAFARTGIRVDAEVNSYLFETLFYPGSALHDGAVIVRGDRIVAASCVLPVSSSQEIPRRLGTRHRAALGLAEETDALAIVVSEETGKISAAHAGHLRYDIDMVELERTIETALGLQREKRAR